MRIYFDEKADAVYLRLDQSRIVESEEAHPGIVLDLNEQNEVVGIELLRVKNRIALADPRKIDFEIA